MRALLLLPAAAFIACAAPRWGRHPAAPAPEDFSVRESTRPARSEAVVPAADAARRGVVVYADLGPDWIDVTGYPAQQRYNYAIYSRVCSRCHTLARSVNSPWSSRTAWKLYVLGMRVASRVEKEPPITKEEREAIIDFLVYDSQVRKVERSREFEELTRELERRLLLHQEAYLRDNP